MLGISKCGRCAIWETPTTIYQREFLLETKCRSITIKVNDQTNMILIQTLSKTKSKLRHHKIMVNVWWFATSDMHYNFLEVNQFYRRGLRQSEVTEMNVHLKNMNSPLMSRRGKILLHYYVKTGVARMKIYYVYRLQYCKNISSSPELKISLFNHVMY